MGVYHLGHWIESDKINTPAELHEAIRNLPKLMQFKDYVHKRLDEAGVPEYKDDPKVLETGCRIERRLDDLLSFRKKFENMAQRELFEDGTAADLHEQGVTTVTAAYMLGRTDFIEEVKGE